MRIKMPELNPFLKIYEKLPDREIIETIENPRHYDPLAVEAAKQELTRRNLSQTEIITARNAAASNKNDVEKIKFGVAHFFKTLISFLSPLFNRWKRIKREYPSSYGLWLITTLLIVGIFIYSFQSNFSQIRFYLFDAVDISLWEFLPLSLPFLVFTAGVILNLFVKRLSWFFLVLYFATNFSGHLSSILYFKFLYENPLIDQSIGSKIMGVDFLYLSVYLILLILLTLSKFRVIYKIGQLSILFAILSPALLMYLIWFDNLGSFALPILLVYLLIAVIWFYLITRKMKTPIVTTYPMDHNLFEEIKEEPKLNEVTVNYDDRISEINQLIKAEKKRRFKASIRPQILEQLGSFGDSKDVYIQLLDNYRSRYNLNIISELMSISSSYAMIKENLEHFIRFGIVEAEYPHKLIDV